MADATKPASKPASNIAAKPGPAPAAAATTTNGAAAPAPAKRPTPANVDELIENAEDRAIPKGCTVRLSPDNPDVASKARKNELADSLEACGIKLVWDSTLAKDAIIIDPPGARK